MKIIVMTGSSGKKKKRKAIAVAPTGSGMMGFGWGMGAKHRDNMADALNRPAYALGQGFSSAPARQEERVIVKRVPAKSGTRVVRQVVRVVREEPRSQGSQGASAEESVKAVGGALRFGLGAIGSGIGAISRLSRHNQEVKAYEEREHERAETGLGQARYDSRGNVIGAERPRKIL